jgi:hypothetical protein
MLSMSTIERPEPGASHETAILARVVDDAAPSLSPDAARALLAFRFPDADQRRMKELLAKAREGMLASDEEDELRGYRHVGHLLELLWSKARMEL